MREEVLSRKFAADFAKHHKGNRSGRQIKRAGIEDNIFVSWNNELFPYSKKHFIESQIQTNSTEFLPPIFSLRALQSKKLL
jgi:hypothetical protein